MEILINDTINSDDVTIYTLRTFNRSLCINGSYIGQWCMFWMHEMYNSCKTCSVNILGVIWYIFWYRLSDIV